MSLLMRKSLLAAKVETTPGTAVSLAAGDATFNVFNISFKDNTQMTKRQQQASGSSLPAITGPRWGELTFQSHLYGDGAAGTPDFASVFLPAVGMVESTGTFSPTLEAPGSNTKTLTMGFYNDGKKKQIRGAMGNVSWRMRAGEIVELSWRFIGVLDAHSDVALLAPTRTTTKPIRFASSTLTLGGAATACFNEISFDLNNTITLIPDPTNVTGYKNAVVTDRDVMGNYDPERRLVATENVFSKWFSHTEEALSIAMTDGTDTITIAAPKLQRTDISPADREGVSVDETSFQCNANSSAGDDELTIDFS